jgi:isopentenyl-diphosphate delta-isomerase
MKENVVLVDADGQSIGTMDKMEAHQKGCLHSALSVFIFNSDGRLLLQQRAFDKYHSAGLWTNSCCSHPRPGESPLAAAHRRLNEEMGLTCELTELFRFTYWHDFENGLTEHEYDHVFVGVSDMKPDADAKEVATYKYMDPEDLIQDMTNYPDVYTAWFKLILGRVLQSCQSINF